MERAGDVRTTSILKKLNAQLDQLAHCIDDLRDETTLEVGTLRLRPNTFAINDLVREIVEEFGSTVPLHRLLIEEIAHVEVSADRERTEQILMNMLTNAIKYTPEEEPIGVSVAAEEEMVTVRVHGHGPGIPADQQAQIFERYYRVTGSQQKQVAGLGLGLYLAAEIVKRQRGKIWWKASKGKAPRFPSRCHVAQLPASAQRARMPFGEP